jgi:hypothetical protein
LGEGWKGVGCEVFPGWIGGFDEGDLLLPGEVLQVFFARDGVVDVLEAFVVDEAVDFVFCGESIGFAIAVLAKTDEQMVGDSDVEGAGAAGENVDEILVVSHVL